MSSLELEQGSDLWLALRKDKVTGVDIPVIMGESPWCDVRTLWRRKMGLDGDVYVNEHMRRGIELEPLARACYNREMRRNCEPAVYSPDSHPWLMASLDGVDPVGMFAVEIKCGKATHEEIRSGKCPKHYYGQLQCQMFVLGLDEIDLMTYQSDDDFSIITVQADKDYQDKMLEKAREFYDCMIELREPQGKHIKRTDQEFIDAADYYRAAKALQRIADERVEETKNRLLSIAEMDCEGGGVKISRYKTAGSVDFDAMKNDGIDVDKYRKNGKDSFRITIEKYEI